MRSISQGISVCSKGVGAVGTQGLIHDNVVVQYIEAGCIRLQGRLEKMAGVDRLRTARKEEPARAAVVDFVCSVQLLALHCLSGPK